ncbi:hypothetical protein D3C77_481680 [compost metagenome]
MEQGTEFKEAWDSWFEGECVSPDFIPSRKQQVDQERVPELCMEDWQHPGN